MSDGAGKGAYLHMREKEGRVLCLFTGGTIAMDAETLSSIHTAQEILEYVRELKNFAAIEAHQVCSIDSVEMQPRHWVEIATYIHHHYDAYDGFVVLHGTDTMVYTAAALSFILQKPGKPIIFTGSQIPLYSSNASDARNNLINAVRFALMDIAGVCIFFGTVLLRGTRARKVSGFDINAFQSFSDAPLGTAGVRLSLSRDAGKRRKARPLFRPALETSVFQLKIFPSMSVEILEMIVAMGYRGIVLETFGTGNIPVGEKSLLPGIEKALKAGIPVVVATQCEKGSAEALYPAGRVLAGMGAIPAHDMTPETALIKLMWVLGQTRRLEEIRRLMTSDLAGELSPQGW